MFERIGVDGRVRRANAALSCRARRDLRLSPRPFELFMSRRELLRDRAADLANLDRARAQSGVFLEHAFDELAQLVRSVAARAEWRGLAAQVHADHFGDGATLERRVAGQGLVGD